MRHRMVVANSTGQVPIARRCCPTWPFPCSLTSRSRRLLKAKELRKVADKIITLGKRGLHSRRRALSFLQNQDAVTKLFDILADRYKDRHGGYTRVLKAGFRYGDASPMAVIELVDRDIDAKGSVDKARHEAMLAERDHELETVSSKKNHQ